MSDKPDDFDDPDAPASAEEIAASQRLRDALEGSAATDAGAGAAQLPPEIELALSLRAAWDPATLSADENRAVLDATPSAEEQARANELRDALASKREARATDSAGVQLASALASAFRPAALDEAEHTRIVEAALAKMPAQKAPAKVERRSNVVRIAFGVVTGSLALAASIVFVVTTAPLRNEAPLAKARTTQPLFSEPFKPGETSARINRIASARASDFRNNRFSKWGVR